MGGLYSESIFSLSTASFFRMASAPTHFQLPPSNLYLSARREAHLKQPLQQVQM
jgi:hypothetical protein